ncbi:hypothetical protein [Methylobacterium sp. J-068]|uniref:hypothetical protein n=1 Tax=Methylobacterium sp. J-068 TaxID=2836649 RepID=UPI001FBA1FEB|nr:hypothetical protein [Methylobacterium sp. J-068]MCJ2035452.1 hypothetical protein [Methylobacterium sp. J-068]
MVPHRLVMAVLLCLGTFHADAAERVVAPSLCPDTAPEGVRLPARAGCGNGGPPRAARDARGVREIDGVQIRVGGRVSVESGLRR